MLYTERRSASETAIEFVIDKLRVAGVMKNKHRGVSLSCLFYCSFVSHKDPPSLVIIIIDALKKKLSFHPSGYNCEKILSLKRRI